MHQEIEENIPNQEENLGEKSLSSSRLQMTNKHNEICMSLQILKHIVNINLTRYMFPKVLRKLIYCYIDLIL